MTPNIFSYAPSELSQDAFICWLVACGAIRDWDARQANGRLQQAGIAFVEALFKSSGARVIPQGQDQPQHYRGDCRATEIIGLPERQRARSDVYFQAKVDDKTVSFLIEDKTGTEMHGEQLQKYLKSIRDDCVSEDLIKPVYFKTGYVFDDERGTAEKAGYSVFDGRDMIRLLEPLVGTHELIRQFREHLAKHLEERAAALQNWNMDHDFVQWKFMVRLRKLLDPNCRTMLPARGRSRGGSPWTQYPNWRHRGALFWRLDPGTALRLMVNPSKDDKTKLDKDLDHETWDHWSAEFVASISAEEGLRDATFRRTRYRSDQLVNEGTIGAISLDRLKDDGHCFLKRVARVHSRFLDSIGRSDEERAASELSDHT